MKLLLTRNIFQKCRLWIHIKMYNLSFLASVENTDKYSDIRHFWLLFECHSNNSYRTSFSLNLYPQMFLLVWKLFWGGAYIKFFILKFRGISCKIDQALNWKYFILFKTKSQVNTLKQKAIAISTSFQNI